MTGETQPSAEKHPGRNHIQHPLYTFSIGRELCLVYNFVPGITLNKYLNGKPTMEKILLFAQILSSILSGTHH